MRLSTLSRSVIGARAVITGAGSGMGRATAHLFADEGARVLVVDRNPASVELVVSEIESAHGRGIALGVSGDVSLATDRHEIVRVIVEAWGGVDVL
jgi:3-oxoacyl-[acyl-carrier protein] reductase